MPTHPTRTALVTKLTTWFPDIPLIFREDGTQSPQSPYFRTELALAELVPLSKSRYAARFHFRIFYVTGPGMQPVSAIMDQMLETLTSLEVNDRLCRASSVAWQRPEAESEEGFFRAEYAIQLTTDQVETGTKMQTLKQGGGLK